MEADLEKASTYWEQVMSDDREVSPDSLAERVKRLRESKRFSQDAFARLVGVTKNQVHLVESGVTKMLQPATLERYASVLEVSEEYLRRGVETPPKGMEHWPSPEEWARGAGVRDEEHVAFLARTYWMLLRMERNGEGFESGGGDGRMDVTG